MKYSATIFALAAAVMAVPNEKRSVDPLSASLAVYSVLPSSLQAEALTNPGAAASEISAEFATATPSWFSELSPDIQTYLLSQSAATSSVLAALSTGLSISNLTSTGIYSNTTTTTSGAAASSTAAATSVVASATTASTASSSSSTGGASMPTQVIGAGIAGAIGLIGMLAL